MKRSEALDIIRNTINYGLKHYGASSGNFQTELTPNEILTALEGAGMMAPIHYPYTCGCSMSGMCPACNPNEYKMYNKWEPEDGETPISVATSEPANIENDLDSKDIYLKNGNEIVGFHSIGHAGPYIYTQIELDGSENTVTADFEPFESWGNNYDENLNMIGRGSFRLITPFIEDVAKDLESRGWVRFTPKEAPKPKK